MKGLSNEMNCSDCPYTCMTDVFTEEDLRQINENKIEIKYNPGDYIIKQGTYVSQVLYLKTGLAKVFLEEKNDRNTILQLVEEKNFIALPVLGNSRVYPYSVITLDECVICHIRKETLIEIMNRNIEFNKFLVNWYSNDYLSLYNRIAVLSTRNNHGKLACALINLINGHEKKSVIENITRKDLSDFASISLESTNKILAELKHDKIIDIKDKSIIILKPDLVMRLSMVG